jgi:transposase InsO family protein
MERNPDAGARPIAFALGVSRKRISRVMRKFGLKPARRPRSFRKVEDERQPEQSYPCVTRYWSPIQPNLLSDFTYTEFHGRWLYLATVMDGFTGEILASNVMTSRTVELIERTIQEAAKKQRRYPEWFHSDQGSQYTAEGITELLLSKGVRISMSPKSSPWRNAMQESFYAKDSRSLLATSTDLKSSPKRLNTSTSRSIASII